MSGPEERVHRGLLLHALYPLAGTIPGLRRLPAGVRRATRRGLTTAAVRAQMRRCRGVRLIGVTGSMGKTTAKDLLAEMLAPSGRTVKTRQNDNGLYGVPASLLLVRPDDGFAVIEVGIRDGVGEMAWMAGMFRPSVVVHTGIGDDHLPVYGSREAIAREKRALLERVGPGGTIVLPSDDEVALASAQGLPARLLSAGWSESSDVRIVSAELAWPHGLDLELEAFGRRVSGRLPLHGRHLAPLAALCVAAAEACGVPAEAALANGASLSPPEGRLQPAPGPSGATYMVDDFKSRLPTALAAVRTLGEAPARRRVAVLGDVQDAEQTADTYAPLAQALTESADRVIALGRCGPILRELLAGTDLTDNLLVLERVDDAVAALGPELREGDLVLFHGSTPQHIHRIHMSLGGVSVGCHVLRCRLRWHCSDCPHLAGGPPASVIEAA